jgi:hypothetical protein
LFSKDRLVETTIRNPISREALQDAITEAVKKSDPGCEAFVGVIVERTKRSSTLEANWNVKGIKFGKADRNKASEVVAAVVEKNATRVRSFGLYDDLNYKVREIPRRREFSCDLFLKWRQSNPSRQFCGPGPPRCPPHSGNSCIGGTSSRRVSCGMIRMTGRRTTRSRRCHPYHLQSKGE